MLCRVCASCSVVCASMLCVPHALWCVQCSALCEVRHGDLFEVEVAQLLPLTAHAARTLPCLCRLLAAVSKNNNTHPTALIAATYQKHITSSSDIARMVLNWCVHMLQHFFVHLVGK